MRTLTMFLSLALAASAAGQSLEREEGFLIGGLLTDAKATSITTSKSPKLPDKKDLTVYVYAPGQGKVTADFGEWLAGWNKSDGEKHGRAEVTGDASRADVILARTVTPWKTTETSDTTFTGGSVSNDPVTRRPVAQPDMPVASYSEAKVYLYVIARGPGGLTILWRGTDKARTDQGFVGPFPGRPERPAGQGVVTEVDAKGLKDSKKPGDRLRDVFFKMMRERT